MTREIIDETDVIVIGAGQAGLATSKCLQARSIPHLVLERGGIGETWRVARWDAFTLLTTNALTYQLPGTTYTGGHPGGFDGRDDLLRYFTHYAAAARLPIREGVTVTAVRRDASGQFRVESSVGAFQTRHVVIATGLHNLPRIPAMATALPPEIHQLHTNHYRHPGTLPDGAVLVVGSGNSGAQIAEEIAAAGRTTYFALGRTGRVPRRYRGHDVFWWVWYGVPFVGGANVTGKNGGKEINLHRFAHDGIHLLGRLTAVNGHTLTLAPDLHERLANADAMYAQFLANVDALIAEMGMDAPPAEPNPNDALRDGFALPVTTSLDLRNTGITTVIWATGFAPDYRWIDLPIRNDTGLLIQERGVTPVFGIYSVGVNHPQSTFISRVGTEAEHVVAQIAAALAGHAADS